MRKALFRPGRERENSSTGTVGARILKGVLDVEIEENWQILHVM